MSITAFTVGALETNCYLLADDGSRRALVIDPGGDPDVILSQVKKAGLSVEGIINTHGHADHISANPAVKECSKSAPIYIHKLDALMLTSPSGNLSAAAGFGRVVSPAADVLLKDGDKIKLSQSIELKVMHTPGHTMGSICLLLEGACIFTGDTLFREDVGRTDLPGGDDTDLANSLKKLMKLDPKLPVFPGHGPASTIGHELKNNPYINNGTA